MSDNGGSSDIPEVVLSTFGDSYRSFIEYMWKIRDNFLPVQEDMSNIAYNIASNDEMEGTGKIISYEVYASGDIRNGNSGVKIKFNVTDGRITESIPCVIHNIAGMEGELPSQVVNNYNKMIHEVIETGTTVKVVGRYIGDGRRRVFVVRHMEKVENMRKSRMTKEHFDGFMKLFENTDIRVVDVMKKTIFYNVKIKDEIATGILLYMLSPKKPAEMMHMAIVTVPGEGKDYLLRNVIKKIVPVGIAESGHLVTVASLVGSMSSDNLKKIELGFLSRYHGERIAISEFETWTPQHWASIIGAMANGEYELNKGQVTSRRRKSTLNVLLIGNPPDYYDYEHSEKTDAFASFGEYKKQMLSRITLIFNTMTLSAATSSDNYDIERLITENINMQNKELDEKFSFIYRFWGEYFSYVSEITAVITDMDMVIEAWKNMQKISGLETILRPTTDERRDPRKYVQFLNLVVGFSRLNGRTQIEQADVDNAVLLFVDSLKTMTEYIDTPDEAYQLNKIDKNVFNAVRKYPGEYISRIAKEAGGTRPDRYELIKESIYKMERMGLLRTEGDIKKKVYLAEAEPIVLKRFLSFARKNDVFTEDEIINILTEADEKEKGGIGYGI